MNYKWCAVPKCKNTSVKTREKLFVSVPKNIEIRRKWLKLAQRNPNEISNSTHIFFCEDHFDMQNDMSNYYQYKMGFSRKIILKDKVLPSKFHCQEDSAERLRDADTSPSVSVNRNLMEDIKPPIIIKAEPSATVVEVCTNDLYNNQDLECKIKLEKEEISNDAPEASEPLFHVNVDMNLESELLIKDEIKTEEDHPQCHICLSVGRRMFPMRQHEEIYRRLLYDEYQDPGDVTFDATLVCWECNATLRNVERFQNRIRQANEMLQMQQNTVPLSTLTTVVFSDSNPNGIYLSEENTRDEMKSENDDRMKDHEDASDKGSDGEDESLEEKETPKNNSVVRNTWAKRPGCDEEFSKKICTKNHYDLVHLKHIKFKCDACEKYFERKADLAKHRRRVHEGVRPPRDKICYVCGRGFTSNKLLAGHARTHAPRRRAREVDASQLKYINETA